MNVSDNISDNRVEEDADTKRMKNAVKDVLKSKNGRYLLGWILTVSGWRTSTTSSDALKMATANGRRDVGLEIANVLEGFDPTHFDLLLKELRDGR